MGIHLVLSWVLVTTHLQLKSCYPEAIEVEQEVEELQNKIGMIPVNQDIVFVIKYLMETWLRAIMRIVHTNGFIILVLALKLLPKENGIVQHVQPTWHDERDGSKEHILKIYCIMKNV